MPDNVVVLLSSNLSAVVASMCLTSLHVRFGLASNIKATTPDTVGAADDVPLKLEV